MAQEQERIEQMIAEFEAAARVIATPIEGFRDIIADVKDGTRPRVSEQHRVFSERHTLLNAGIHALQRILQDGYPVLPILEVSAVEMDDIEDQLRTVTAAVPYFRAKPPLAATVDVGQFNQPRETSQ